MRESLVAFDILLFRKDLLVRAITPHRSAEGDATSGGPPTDSGDVRTRMLTRRRFLGVLGARAAFAWLAAAAGNHKPTVVASAPASAATAEPGEGYAAGHPDASRTAPARLDPFLALSLALVGGGDLDEGRARQYLATVAADGAKQRALDELLARAEKPSASRLSSAARELRKEILEFWYLGTVGGQPVAGGASAWATLHAWQAVQYTPAPSVCKGYGSWAAPVAGSRAAGA